MTQTMGSWIVRAMALAAFVSAGSLRADTNTVGTLDGTFETALPAGSATGDTSRVTNLGVIFPSEGSRALLMTTAPDAGSTPADSQVSTLTIDSFSIPAGYATIRLDYDFLTNEPAPSYANDAFEVKLVLITAGGEETLLASDTFGNFTAAPWTGFDKHTGYRAMIGDVSAIAGTGDLVTLELRIADVGDGRRDSAVVVDNVRLVEPGSPQVVLEQTYYQIDPGEEIIFDASGSFDDAGITEYEWNFGNGYFGFGPVVAMDQYTEQGFYNGSMTVTDGDGHSDTVPFTVSVGPTNTAPSIDSSPVASASEGVIYNYQVGVSDSEIPYGDMMSYSLASAPAGMEIDPDTGLITWDVPVGADKQNAVEVVVTDSRGESTSQAFTVTIGPEVYVATIADDARIWTARSRGDGTFESLAYLEDISLNGSASRGITITDLDGDDDFDIVTGYEEGGNGYFYMFPRDAGTFDTPIYLGSVSGVSGYIEDLTAEDFNNDGRMDVILQGDNSNVWLMKGTGPLVTEPQNFYGATFESGTDGWGGASEVSWGRDDSTAASGDWSMHMVPTNTSSQFSLDINPSDWMLSRGSTVRFAYRMTPGTPVTLFFNVSGFGWIVLGGSPNGDPSTYTQSPDWVTLVDDDAWHVAEIDIYKAIRTVWPTASYVTEFEWWTNNNASNAAGHEFWFDDFAITRPRVVSGLEISSLPSSGSRSRGVDAGDVDRDGDQDFVRALYSSGYSHVYFNDGNANFSVSSSPVADSGTDPYGVVVGDFDSDDVPDLIANYASNGDTYFFRGVGNGTFASGVYIGSLDTGYYASYDGFDFDGDGRLDIVSSNYTNRIVQYYRGNGDGTFASPLTIGGTAGNVLAVAAPEGRRPGQPFALATVDVDEIDEGDTVNLDAAGSYDDSNVVDWAWDFGDGNTGSGQSVSHQYTSEGTYDVVLTVTDDEANRDRHSLKVTVNGAPPVSVPGGPYAIGEAAALQGRWYATLDGTASSDAETSIARYEWDFDAGDGIGVDSTEPYGRAVYDAPGTYTVTLTVYDEVNQATSSSTTVTVSAGAPPVAALSGPAALGEDKASLSAWTGRYGGSASTDDHGIDRFEIDWGDGSTSSFGPLSDNFDDGNYNGWSVNGGSWGVSSGELAQTDTGSAWRWLQQRSHIYRDFQLEVDFKGVSTGDGYLGIVFRNDNGSASTNTFLMYSRNSWDFWRFYDWNTGTVLADGGTGWDPGIWYHLRLVVVGDTMQLYVTPEGGVETLQLEVSSAAHAEGSIGLLANAQNLRYDNVKVTPLDNAWRVSGKTVDDFLHTFDAAGIQDVTLTVTDHAAQTNTSTVQTSTERGAPPVADTGGPYVLNEAAASHGRWNLIMDASGSTDDNNIERYTIDFGDGTSYTTGFSNGRKGSYFATGTDLYGYDTAGANLQRIVATENDTYVEIVNLANGNVIASTTLNRMQTWNNVSPGDGVHFKIQATKPVAGYFTDLAYHAAFMPSLDGDPVGKEFIFHHDRNDGFFIYAFEDTIVSFYETNGSLSWQFSLLAGQYASSSLSDNVKRVVSSGRIAMQTHGYNAYTTVPSETGDGAGRLFYFSTDNWSTGAIAVFAYEAADVQVFDLDSGALLYTTSIAAGNMWYRNGVGDRRLRLESTADVEVWAGDTEGGSGINNLGDDVSFAGGRNGTEFVLHNLQDGIVIFAPNDNTEVTIDGAVVTTLNLDEFLHLAPGDFASGSGVHRISTTQPVLIQTLGRANSFNDLGTYLGGVSMRHQYMATGTYDVTLTVTDNTGQTDTAVTTVEVLANDPPVADIDAPDVAGEAYATGGVWTVVFDAGASSDDFGIASYQWNFGDGSTGAGAQVSHNYSTPGTYDITLTVTDHAGQSVQTSQQLIVEFGTGPTADAGGPYVFGEEAASYGIWTATLDGTGSTDDAAIYDYLWQLSPILEDDFGDDFLDPTDWASSGANEAGGVVTIGGVSNWRVRGIRQNRDPIDRVPGTEFTGRVKGTGGSRLMFGVYQQAPPNFDHVYMYHAIYFDSGSLRIYERGSNRGYNGSYTQGVWYDVRIVLRASGADYYVRRTGESTWTQLTNYSSRGYTQGGLRLGATVYNGSWELDDFSTGPLLLSGPVVTVEKNAPGVFPVTLTVRDNALQSDSDSTTFTIEDGAPPVADPGGPYTAEVGQLLNFNGTNSTDDNAIQRYHWSFGDFTGGPDAPGSKTANLPFTATGATPQHHYDEVGTYDVELTVTDNTLKSDVATTTVDVIVGDPPTAVASVSSGVGAGGPPAYFDGRASFDDFGVVEYRWDFDDTVDRDGDGDATNDIDAVGAMPFHTYAQATGDAGDVFGDDFEGAALDSSVWQAVGATQSGGVVDITGVGNWTTRYLTSVQTIDRISRVSATGQVQQTTSGGYVMWGFKNANTDPNYTQMPHAIYFANGSIYIYENGSQRGRVGFYTRGVKYDVRIDLKPAGADYYFRESGASDWTSINPSSPRNLTTTPLRLHATVNSGATTFDNFKVEDFGPYVATLTVEDGAGQTSQAQVEIAVSPNEAPDVITVPWVAFDPIAPHETYNGKAIRLKGIVRDADPVSYEWDFGDGTSSGSLSVTNSYDLSITHTYPDAPAGTPFTATLTVTDSAGNTGSADYPVVVRPLNLNTEINVAIDEGLWYLHTQQTRSSAQGYLTGYWTHNARASATASSIQAFQVNGHLESVDHSEDPYAETVMRGLRQLFRDLGTINISTQTYGEPDTNGNGIAIQTGVNGSGNQPIYQGGQVMDAIASSGYRLARTVTGSSGIKRRSYFDILTDMVDAFSWGQTEQGSGGGWRYSWNNSIDNSAAQWGAIGMLAAEDIFGIPIPEWVKERNVVWLDRSYGSPGWGYTGGGATRAGTPSGLVQLVLDDIEKGDNRWADSERWIANNWTNQYIINQGNRPYYPYYALTKAMRLARPEPVETFYNGFDWFRDENLGLARTLIDDQQSNGQFPGSEWITGQLRSAWGVIILSRTLFVQPPVADAGRDRVWGVDLPLEFDGSASFHLDPFRDIVLYEWDFDGDGVFDFSSDQPTATHTYLESQYPEPTLPQTITARLRVTDNNSPPLTDTDTIEIIIAIPPHPPVAEAGGPYTCTAGLPCELDGSGSTDIDPTDFIARYEWDLDGFPFDYDGATGVNPTPVFTVGQHNIGLRVWDNGVLNDLDGDGELDENERLSDVDFATVNAVVNEPPVADANGPYTIDEGQSTGLDATGSSDPNGDPLVFEWDLDDDGVYDDAIGPTPTFLGVDDGSYPVSVRVTDTLLEDFATSTVTVNNVPPTVDAGPDVGLNEGSPFTFGASFTDPGTTDTHTIEWNFGDGETSTGTLSPTHTWTDDGVYTVTLTVTDDDGGIGIDTVTVTVGDLAPQAVLTGDQALLEGQLGLYDASASTSSPDAIVGYEWDLDYDGSFDHTGEIGPTASRLFEDNGAYTVAVRVTDDDGSQTIATLPVLVSNVAPTVEAGPDATLDEGSALVQSGSFADPGADTWTATVDYGEGAGPEPLLLNPDKAFDLTNLYEDDGVYTVSVTVTDDDGGTGGDSFLVTVNDLGPTASVVGDTALIEGDTGDYDATGSSSSPDAIVGYEWDFDYDGSTFVASGDSDPTVTHLFADEGVFTVAVRVTDEDGSTDIATLPVTVTDAAVLVTLGPDTTIDEGETFTQPGSFVDPGSSAWTATVDYGDGSGPIPLLLEPDQTFTLSHTYLDDGLFTVTVVVSNDEGGSGSATVDVTVNDLAPTAALTGDESLNEGDTGTYDATGSTSSPDAIVGYEWDFDFDGTFDPSGDTTPVATHTFADDGAFVVAVRVTDDDGSVSVATLPVTVHNVPPLVDAGPDASIDEGSTFAQSGAFVDPGSDAWTATVDYGDGSGSVPLALNGDKTFDLSHVYSASGVYVATVVVTDDEGGAGADTVTVTVNEVAVDPPAPTDLMARAKSTKIQLVWSYTGADSYNVYRSLTAGGPYTLIANTTSTYSTYLDEGLTNGTTYYYVVTSVVGGVESSTPSNEASGTPTETRIRRRR